VSATQLLVLGVINGVGQAHGYQVRHELLTWRADMWAKVAPGSIYQAIRTLTKNGLLEQVATEAAGGPERTIYRITPAGETRLRHLLRTGLADPDTGPELLNAAFAYLTMLPRAEAAALFDARAAALLERLPSFELDPAWRTPEQVQGLMRLHRARVQAELDWAQLMARDIRAGDYAFAD
jgi:DNA-binding PadR family transcriptional regulator